MANYSFQDPDIPDGSVINEGNFSQLAPDTAIMVGKTLTINNGNFTNVRQQPEWTINGGNWTQKSFCSHLHPAWIALGLPDDVTECSHMISKEDISIDSVVIDTIYVYEDTLL